MKNCVIISILSLLLGIITALCFIQFISKKEISQSPVLSIDTVFEVIPSEPLVMEKVKTKIVYTRDTIIQTQPFIASVDTIVKQDTISAKYEFPENLFSMLYRPASDTIKTVMIKTEKFKENESNWWKGPALAVAGVVVGYLIGKYSEK